MKKRISEILSKQKNNNIHKMMIDDPKRFVELINKKIN